MADKDAEFLKKLLVTFRIEAEEHLKGISSGLLELEGREGAQRAAEIVEAVFRHAHSLKGAARAVNLTGFESLCQAMESVFSSMKKGEVTLTTPLFDLLQEAADHLSRTLPAPGAEPTPQDLGAQRSLAKRLEEAALAQTSATPADPGPELGKREEGEEKEKEKANPPEERDDTPTAAMAESSSFSAAPLRQPPPAAPAVSPATETVRVSTAKLTSVLLKSEEMLSAKLAAWQRAMDLRDANEAFVVWKKEWSRVLPLVQGMKPVPGRPGGIKAAGDADRRRSVGRLLEFIEWNGAFVKAMGEKYAAESKRVERDSRVLGGMVNNLLEDMKKVLMFPFSSLLEILPKLVRDLSRDSGKEINLVVRGGEIEIDRRILEEMKDPLLHLVRNCIDHGLEKPEVRRCKNKLPGGTITVTVAPMDDKVEMVVADDGTGISSQEVRNAVARLGAASKEKVGEMTDLELLPYIFQSGVSTSPIITELSGRGLGLAIVREKVEKLGGSVTFDTAPEVGTSFRIVLPLTVATFRGVLVRACGRDFILPTMHVGRAVRFKKDDVRTVENRETIQLDGKPLSLVRLAAILELPTQKHPATADLLHAVVLSASGTEIAFAVDEVVNEQEVLLKGLGKQLSRVRNVAGATVLGDGLVVPILNVPDLLKSAVKSSLSTALFTPLDETGETADRKRTVMVVEDSITTRTLLKNILEAAGYDVAVAVDGLDAFGKLKSGRFDLVVSDVDMPRMNGFDLTAKIRGDKVLGETPVVLVTALSSREDRERGIDVGASAYIVKSSFDQSNLLEVVNRLA